MSAFFGFVSYGPAYQITKAVFAFLAAFVTTYTLVPVLIVLAHRLGVMDVPDGSVKKHVVATPYLGGLAVYAGFLAGISLVLPIENKIVFLIVGTTLLLLIGLIDDLVVLKPYQKFGGQILACLCFLKAGLYLKEQFFRDYLWAAVPVSLLWFLTVINGFNLIDVMDGLATTVAIGASLSYLVISLLFAHDTSYLLLVAFMGSLMAFFWYNKPRAKMYLGDTGSLFIGGFLATFPFLIPWSSIHSYGFLVPAIVLAIPLFEVASLIVIRSYKQIPFYRPSPDHFCHYLQRWGWSVPQILIIVAIASNIALGATLLLLFGYIGVATAVVVALAIFATWLRLTFKK
jgi:UDP-GlcNAc:undecaprenyl-phosphate/decaprenyl-phosphate GlcNAc-1-phosphate transferase